MIESMVLGAVVVLFKAAFAGEDLDRQVGSQVIGTVIDGLLRTTSTTDPVLLQIHQEIKELKTAPYDQAMDAGHRYLEESRLSIAVRGEKLKLAREQLVNAASAATRLKVPMLTANAEFAIAKCDVLLGMPEHAEMALRRASAALEAAIEKIDVSATIWRSLVSTKFTQDESMGKWFDRLTSGMGLVSKADIAAAEQTTRGALASLVAVTELYSQVQTATLAASGRDNIVVWAPPADEDISSGLRDKAVATAAGGVPVCGFGLTLTVERHVIWRPEGKLAVDLLMSMTAREDMWLYCRAKLSIGPPTTDTKDAAAVRASDAAPWLVGKPVSTMFTVRKGTYRGWLRVEAESEALELVNLRPSRLDGDRRISTDASFRIPLTPYMRGPLRSLWPAR